MGRYTPNKSYGHNCKKWGFDSYDISWTIDRYIKGSILRYPTLFTRMTDEKGAKRFCKKHDLSFPE